VIAASSCRYRHAKTLIEPITQTLLKDFKYEIRILSYNDKGHYSERYFLSYVPFKPRKSCPKNNFETIKDIKMKLGILKPTRQYGYLVRQWTLF
jgi:hypothetical protein